ncbi:MAG TPA: hypothetical protein PLE92_02705 [Lentisphaeria bacterium]|jgi:hypothetical protein|nr:MAG: hypothetical protein BWX73_01286 [Lentisphaerae bacterium ADurb.Bin082]HQC52015.1 hypothetical protein [Lentisphaeria bacterium]
MLKLSASYSKKIPAETEYSSQSYHCQIESELPDGLTAQQLQERIHATFEMVRQSVEAELHGTQAAAPLPEPVMPPVQPAPASVQQNNSNRAYARQRATANQTYNEAATNVAALASSKQINYLLNLAKRAGWTVQNIIDHCQVNRLEEIGKRQCSQLIEQFSGRAA